MFGDGNEPASSRPLASENHFHHPLLYLSFSSSSQMTTSEVPSDLLQESFSIELPATANEDLQPSHSLKDNTILKSSSEELQSSHLVKGGTTSLPESSSPPTDMLLQPPHSYLGDDLQEPQELFHNVLESQTPQDLLLNDLEPRTQELLLHDMQPTHSQTFPIQPQEQLQGFVCTSREKNDLQNSLSLPVVDSFLAPLPQNLVAMRESSAECDAAAPSHLSASLEYSDLTYITGATTTSLVTPITPSPKITQRLREKKKSKHYFVVFLSVSLSALILVFASVYSKPIKANSTSARQMTDTPTSLT